LHQTTPEIIEEENYFFRLSKYSKEIERILEKDKIKIIPDTRKREILNFVRQGLEDISFSRPSKDLKWGIQVPNDKSQTIYVWADALINYISALGYSKKSSKFQKFWPADVHCIGKDILKFHGAIWPGMLLSLKLPLPKNIFVHGFITVSGQKMSKSLGNVIDPFELVKKYGVDPVRYFLLREIPPTEDGDYTRQKFEGRYNADLASGLGNLVARVITLGAKLKIKNEKLKMTIQSLKIKKEIDNTNKKYKKALREFKFNETLIAIWNLISFCDKYIERQQPWRLLPSNPKSQTPNSKLKEILYNLLFALENIAEMLEPFLPETSEKILEQIKTKKSEPLFPRLDKI
jgi:methionyl-tRNA synthetase